MKPLSAMRPGECVYQTRRGYLRPGRVSLLVWQLVGPVRPTGAVDDAGRPLYAVTVRGTVDDRLVWAGRVTGPGCAPLAALL